MPLRQASLTVTALSDRGDGIAHDDTGRIFVPGALPGEKVTVEMDGTVSLLSVDQSSDIRVTPPCPLFGECGGCTTQHLASPAALAWKSERVERALALAGFDNASPRATQVAPGTRRRIDLAARRVPGGIVLGLHRRNGEPVDMRECHVLDPRIVALLDPLRTVLASLGAITADADLLINWLDSGADLLLATDRALEPSDRTKLAAFATAHKVPRIAWRPRRGQQPWEVVAQNGGVMLDFAGAKVAPSPAAFLQASPDGEAAIVQAVIAGLPKLNRRDIILELYAGCGTLTFPLSEHGRVVAYEGDADAAAALRRAMMGRRIEITARDLVRQPVMAKELSAAKICVLDPPYAGASAQIAEIVSSDISRVIYVSCNPRALEIDAARLHEAGFTLDSVAVIDQFLWSAEVESVCVFKRGSSRRNRSGPSRSG